MRTYNDRIENMQKEIERLRTERDDLAWRLSETRKSKSYKLGMLMTSLPRKIKK